MTTPVEKRNENKFCEFHREVGDNTDECNHLRKQIEDMLKAENFRTNPELKQSSGKDQPKKKGETSGKEKPQAILMIQSQQKPMWGWGSDGGVLEWSGGLGLLLQRQGKGFGDGQKEPLKLYLSLIRMVLVVERANRSLGEGTKARLGKDNKNWMEEISHILWAHRTMVKSSNGDTPFSPTYGTEAVIPAEIRMPTLRTAELDMAKNDEALQINLELLEEKREQAAITEAKSKRQMEKYYNAKVRNTSFKP
ncbi:reverse transcriptase domain-containing protein [Tanacetum coccineum]